MIAVFRMMAVCLLLGFLSCKTSKKATGGPVSLRVVNKEILLASLQTELPFTHLNFKGTADIRHPDYEGSASVQLIWQIDSQMLITIKKFGFEVFRIWIQRDSVSMLDRINHIWDKGSTNEWAGNYGISGGFHCLQSVLLRGAYCPAEIDFEQVNTDSNRFDLQGAKSKILWTIGFHKETLEPINTALQYQDLNVDIRILSYQNLNQHALPSSWQLNYRDTLDYLDLQMKWYEIQPSVSQAIRFQIPSHYTRDKLL